MNYLIFGGTGSLGKVLIERLLSKDKLVAVFSRDEAKHVVIKSMFPSVKVFMGDVRDYNSVFSAISAYKPSVLINAAALKNVPECEENPTESVKTNVLGCDNVMRAASILASNSRPIKALFVSTDKACSPCVAYGMSKALAERVALSYNSKNITVNVTRYGNVLESRGSVIPFFKQRIKEKKTLPVTHKDMTRFFMSLSQSVDLIERALKDSDGGKVFVPYVKSASINDLAEVMCERYGYFKSMIEYTGIRAGEKIDELLISNSEVSRTQKDDDIFMIHSMFTNKKFNDIQDEYSSGDAQNWMDKEELYKFLKHHGVFS